MGNQAPTREDSERQEYEAEVQRREPAKEEQAVLAEKQRRRALHLRESEDEDGRVTCSCGHQALDEHSYNLHIEVPIPHPPSPSGICCV
jgi:hypothetical protein